MRLRSETKKPKNAQSVCLYVRTGGEAKMRQARRGSSFCGPMSWIAALG